MPIIITIQPHLIGIDDGVVVLFGYRLCVAGIAFFLLLCDVIGDHLVFEAILQGGGAGDAGSQLQHVAVQVKVIQV